VANGHRAMMFYLVQRTDAAQVTLAADIDPTYAAAFKSARAAGVGVLAHACHISPDAITLGPPLPFIDP
ncbi:DNA/RNA nuclease SfsA, partial [Roseobacter sp.]